MNYLKVYLIYEIYMRYYLDFTILYFVEIKGNKSMLKKQISLLNQLPSEVIITTNLSKDFGYTKNMDEVSKLELDNKISLIKKLLSAKEYLIK